MDVYREGRLRRATRQAVTIARATRAGRARVCAHPAAAAVDAAALRDLLAGVAAEARLVQVPAGIVRGARPGCESLPVTW